MKCSAEDRESADIFLWEAYLELSLKNEAFISFGESEGSTLEYFWFVLFLFVTGATEYGAAETDARFYPPATIQEP